jgi:hypothetical protein
MAETTTRETLGFQAEVKQLLNLMIHSLYSNKEIFLRELISNASDAADKLRFEALADNALYGGDTELKVEVLVDQKARTLTVRDNGIGMSRDEVIRNIGTIARSGTREFFQSLTGDQAKDARLIGQFGVGSIHPSSSRIASRSPRGVPGCRRAKACAGNATWKRKRAPTASRPCNGRCAAPRWSCTCGRARTSCWTSTA